MLRQEDQDSKQPGLYSEILQFQINHCCYFLKHSENVCVFAALVI